MMSTGSLGRRSLTAQSGKRGGGLVGEMEDVIKRGVTRDDVDGYCTNIVGFILHSVAGIGLAFRGLAHSSTQ